MTTEETFYRDRRMFAIVDGVVHLAPRGDPRNHVEWLIGDGLLRTYDDPAFTTIVRGFYLNGTLVGYRGRDFKSHGVREAFAANLDVFEEKLDLDDDVTLYAGVKTGNLGDVWEGRLLIGTLGMMRGRGGPADARPPKPER